jgi:hypothetical protein
VGGGAWPAWRRRAEPDREGQELWLAAGLLWSELRTLNRIIFDGHGGAKTAERWDVGKRIRDVEEGPDGSLWMLEDANPGTLIHVTSKQ